MTDPEERFGCLCRSPGFLLFSINSLLLSTDNSPVFYTQEQRWKERAGRVDVSSCSSLRSERCVVSTMAAARSGWSLQGK